MTDEQVLNEIIECGRAIAKLNARMDAAFKRIDEQKQMSDSLHTLAISVERQTAQLEQQGRELAILRADVDVIKDKPGKRWDLIVVGIISAVVTALVTRFIK